MEWKERQCKLQLMLEWMKAQILLKKYMQYDYNYAAGWIAIADYPKIISLFSITTTIG